MHQQLYAVNQEFVDAGNGGRMQGRLGELWAVIARVRTAYENGRLARDNFDWDGAVLKELETVSRSIFFFFSLA